LSWPRLATYIACDAMSDQDAERLIGLHVSDDLERTLSEVAR
jgi:hypothetical protein